MSRTKMHSTERLNAPYTRLNFSIDVLAAAEGRQLALPAFAGTACLKTASVKVLLQFDLAAAFFQLLLHRFGIGFRNAFLDHLRRAFDQILGFLQA